MTSAPEADRGGFTPTRGAVQTVWAELIASTLAEAGVRVVVVSPGSRSTPLTAALASQGRCELPTLLDERAAAFYALGVARATGVPAALVCTSGSAAAHYYPAIVEASAAGVPLIVLTADRPPELQHAGASQTIDQARMYGTFVRAAFDLGAPEASPLALRAVRRTLVQAITAARGPLPGPVHINVPLRKPLEPTAPSTDEERALAKLVHAPVTVAPPRLAADRTALDALAQTIASEPHGVIVAGALPIDYDRNAVFALAARAGYPILAEATSQLRLGPRPSDVTIVDFFDIALASSLAPAPRLVIQLGAEPVAQAWPALAGPPRHVLTDGSWRDPDGTARSVIAGDWSPLVELVAARDQAWSGRWRELNGKLAAALDRSVAAHPRSETAVVRTALDATPEGTLIQIGNSLPVRVIDHVPGGGALRPVISQRGAAGIDGMIASAAGATRAGHPVLLVLGDVSFAHDLGSLLAARDSSAPLAILVIDNGGGRIFNQLPYAKVAPAATLEHHWTTPPRIDPVAVATALGLRAISGATHDAIATALTTPGATIIHAPVSATGAQDVRRHALELLDRGIP